MTAYLDALPRRRFLLIAATAATAAAAALAGCTSNLRGTTDSSSPAPPSTGDSPVPRHLESAALRTAPGDPIRARTALAGFGADFLRQIEGDQNTVISPYSLYTVLAMARAGAKNRTAEQLDVLLGLDGADQGGAITAVDNGIAKALDAAKRVKSALTIQAANETWVQQGLDVQQAYLDELAREFGVSAVVADFHDDPEGMRAAINSWVSDRTNALIPKLFPPDSIVEDTKVVLVNALYLKAPWSVPFVVGQPGPFQLRGGGTVTAPMMSAPGQVGGASGNGWSAVTVDYAGHRLAMTLLVPDPGEFDRVLEALDGDLMSAAAGTTQLFELTMPLFKISSIPDAKRIVQQLGVVDIFQDQIADLSGIALGPGVLFANTFVHQARITVDENGTEAAAATGMGMMASGAPAPAPKLTIDRPFLFWIAEAHTGSPLFLGVVTNPVG